MLLQMKIYEELGYSNLYKEENSHLLDSVWVKELINNGATTISDLFFDFHIPSFEDDEIFKSIANYAKENQITKLTIDN